MKFTAEIKKVSAKKLVSLDMEYEVVIRTQDPQVLELGKWPADEMVHMEVKREHETGG
jgi:hypothetical protein